MNPDICLSFEKADIETLKNDPNGITVPLNLGNTIELAGGNKIILSEPLHVTVKLVGSEFL